MTILEWIEMHRPGEITRLNDRIEIRHLSGEHSTLWLKPEECNSPPELMALGDLYSQYDGVDLFSSTFKIAAIKNPKFKRGVEIVFSLSQIDAELNNSISSVPEGAVAFMYQQGIGIYTASGFGGVISEWDTENFELSGNYNSVYEIFDEWLNAVK